MPPRRPTRLPRGGFGQPHRCGLRHGGAAARPLRLCSGRSPCHLPGVRQTCCEPAGQPQIGAARGLPCLSLLPAFGGLRWYLLPLQELLLLLPVGVNQLLWDQLHQLQAFLYLHQDLEVLPASHLEEGRTRSPGLRFVPVPPGHLPRGPFFSTRPRKVRCPCGQGCLGHVHPQILLLLVSRSLLGPRARCPAADRAAPSCPPSPPQSVSRRGNDATAVPSPALNQRSSPTLTGT